MESALNRKLIPSAMPRLDGPHTSAEIEEGANRAGEAFMERSRQTRAIKSILDEEVPDAKVKARLLRRLEKERIILPSQLPNLRKLMGWSQTPSKKGPRVTSKT